MKQLKISMFVILQQRIPDFLDRAQLQRGSVNLLFLPKFHENEDICAERGRASTALPKSVTVLR